MDQMMCPFCLNLTDGICDDCCCICDETESHSVIQTLCPDCGKPVEGVCEDCGCSYDTSELIVTDLYNYHARPQRQYNRLDHFKEVLGQFQGREGKQIPAEILERIKAELPEPKDATAVDVKKVIRKLKLTKYMENFYYILFAVPGQEPPYIRREVEDKMIRMFKQIDRIYGGIDKDNRKSFLNYYYIIFKLLQLMKQSELLMKVPLIRTIVRLRQHDHLWKRICRELAWEFILTDVRFMRSSIKPRQQLYKTMPRAYF
jgi:hypothetical protein